MSDDIFLAVSRGDTAALKHCIKNGCDVNSKGVYQNTPLHHAANRGHTEIVQILIQAGADVNVTNKLQITPLYKAAGGGHTETVRILIQGGADVNVENKFQSTPLHKAAVEGHTETVQILIQAGADINEEDASTQLHHAAAGGYTEIVQILIQAGAEVNVKDKDQDTPLHKAAVEGHTETVQILIQAGADINVKDVGHSAPLHEAAVHGHTETVQILIQAGADVNVKNKYQRTPLDYAAGGGHIEIVQKLIHAGADVNGKDEEQNTPLHESAVYGHTEIVQILIQAGADVNVKNKDQSTPLHNAADGGHTEIVHILIQAGADINGKDKILLDKMVNSSEKIKSIVEEFEDLFKKVPKEVRILGEEATYMYANALRKDSLISNVIRVMLVGHFGVGKTTIAMNLLGKTERNISSTDGIDVFINQCLYHIEEGTWHQNEDCSQTLSGLKHYIRLDLTDFAGQLIFYTTHQTYLTSRGLYLLVFNLALGLEGMVDDEDLYPRKSQHRRMIDFLEYWISMIVTYAKGEQHNFPRIILIGTHKDQIKNDAEIKSIKEMIEENFRDLISSSQVVLRDELFINAKNMSDATRKVIREAILDEGKKYREFGEPVPSSWIALQEKLIDLKRDNKIIVQLHELKKINSQMNIPLSDGELKVFLKVLHNMGYALYFDLSTLGDKVILDPKVVIDSMRSFITCERFILRLWKKWQFNQMRRSGRIKISHVHGMLKEKCGSNISEHSEHLLGIMEQLDLVCQPMSYNKGSKVSPDFYLVPCMMSADMPLAPLELNRESGLIITFSSENILPPAIFNRLVCSCLSLWEIFDHHFYNGLVALRSGKFHLIEMKREIKQIVVTFSHTESTKRPDAEWCLAIKLFLTATIEKIVAVYSTSLGSPVICNSSELDDLLRDVKTNEDVGFDDKDQQSCACKEYEKYPLEDVNLMRIAQHLRRMNLSIPMLCTVILNDAQYSSQIEEDFKGFHGDIKAFYILKRWRQTTQSCGFKGLKSLLKDHINISNEHILCQAMQSEVPGVRAFVSTNSVLTVYDEFLSITADRVGYEFMQLGLELGLTLAEIESLQMEKGNNILQISRSMFMKWYNRNKEDATFLKLAMAFLRCGIQNLDWMDMEFDVEKSKASGAKSCTIS